jgi:hypothetical protein
MFTALIATPKTLAWELMGDSLPSNRLYGFVAPPLNDRIAINLEEAVVNITDHVLGLVLVARDTANKSPAAGKSVTDREVPVRIRE